jgi:hypothetical protein
MQFTHEHREVQKSLKRLIDQEINPHVDEWEEAGIFIVLRRPGKNPLVELVQQ